MAYNVVIKRINALGFCCPFIYFHTVRFATPAAIAEELGVHRRTVRKWRSAYRNDKLLCWQTRNCFLTTQKAPVRYHGSSPVPAEGLDLALVDE